MLGHEEEPWRSAMGYAQLGGKAMVLEKVAAAGRWKRRRIIQAEHVVEENEG